MADGGFMKQCDSGLSGDGVKQEVEKEMEICGRDLIPQTGSIGDAKKEIRLTGVTEYRAETKEIHEEEVKECCAANGTGELQCDTGLSNSSVGYALEEGPSGLSDSDRTECGVDQLVQMSMDVGRDVCGEDAAEEASVSRLVRAGTDGYGRTPLHVAAARGSVGACRRLLQWGANANLQNVIGQTPLSVAAAAGHADVCRLLIGVTDNINGKDRYGDTALDVTGSAEVCGLLLVARAAISQPLGHVPHRVMVLEEAHSGSLAGVRFLVEERGMDVNQRDHLSFRSALHRAAAAGKDDVCEYLLTRQVVINSSDRLGNAPLHLAANAATAIHLLAAGADVNVLNSAGELPLHTTAPHNSRQLTQHVINNVTDVTTRSTRGETALHIAARAGAYDVAFCLLPLMGDVNMRDNAGNTPLHVLRGDANALCELLVEVGAQVDAKNDAGDTTMLVAARIGGRTLVNTLIAIGADVNLSNNHNETALHAAVAGGHGAVAEALAAVVEDVEPRDADGCSPLHLATKTLPVFLPEICRALVARGASIDSVDGAGLTPLAAAVKAGHVTACDTLLRLGADPNKRLDRCHLPGARAHTAGASNTSSGTGDRRHQDRAPALFLAPTASIMTLLLQHGAQLGLRVNVWQDATGGMSLRGSIPDHCSRRHCQSYTHLDLLLHGLKNSCLDAQMQAHTLLDLYLALDARCVWQASCIVRESTNRSGALSFIGAKRADRLQRLLAAGGHVSGLLALCRAVVRGALTGAGRPGRGAWRGPGMAARVAELPLPRPLCKYLMLPELTELLVGGGWDIAVSRRVVGTLAV